MPQEHNIFRSILRSSTPLKKELYGGGIPLRTQGVIVTVYECMYHDGKIQEANSFYILSMIQHAGRSLAVLLAFRTQADNCNPLLQQLNVSNAEQN